MSSSNGAWPEWRSPGGASLSVAECHVVEMRSARREGGAPGEEDGLRFAGVSASVTNTVVSGCDDDGVDLSAGSALFTGCAVNTPVDKGFTLLDQSLALHRSRVENADVGISVSISPGATATAFPLLVSDCSVRAEAHPANVADGGPHGVALHVRDRLGTATFTLPVTVSDSILSAEVPVLHDYGNTPSYPGEAFPQIAVNRSCLHDSGGANPADPLPAGAGNLAADPLFADLAAAIDLHLTVASPCIDAANPAETDPDGSRAEHPAPPLRNRRHRRRHPHPVDSRGQPLPRRRQHHHRRRRDPGSSWVNVWFNAGARLTVHGRVLAEGSEHRRIRFGPVPGTNVIADVDPIKNGIQTGLPKWGGIRVVRAARPGEPLYPLRLRERPGNQPRHGGKPRQPGLHPLPRPRRGPHVRRNPSAHALRAQLHPHRPPLHLPRHVPDGFRPGPRRATRDFLASADNKMEPLKVEYPTSDVEVNGNPAYHGLPSNGWFRVYGTTFNGNRGHQDVFDADSGLLEPARAVPAGLPVQHLQRHLRRRAHRPRRRRLHRPQPLPPRLQGRLHHRHRVLELHLLRGQGQRHHHLGGAQRRHRR